MAADLLAFALRALGFVALFHAAGTAFFIGIFAEISDQIRASIGRLGVISAAAAIACFIAQQTFEAARFAGDLSGIVQGDLVLLAWKSASGMGQVLRVAGLLLIVAGRVAARSRWGSPVAIAGAAIALLSFLLSGHTSTHEQRLVLAPALGVHLFAAAFWFGSLLPLYLICRHERLDRAAAVLRRFSRIAGGSVSLILVAGIVLILVLAPDLSVLQRPYGQLVLFKLGAFVLLMILAACNRWRLVPAMAAGDRAASDRLRRSISTEIALITAVLAITAALTLFFSPEG